MIAIIINVLQFLIFAIFARIIVSWIAPQQPGGSNNPIVNMIYQITDPILAPFRKIIPRVGMFDFTPMFAMLTLVVIIAVLRDSQ